MTDNWQDEMVNELGTRLVKGDIGVGDCLREAIRRTLDKAAEAVKVARKKRGDGMHGYDGKDWWNVADEMEAALRQLMEPGK